MNGEIQGSLTAFEDSSRIAEGAAGRVAVEVKRRTLLEDQGTILIFNDLNGEQVDLDLTGTVQEVEARLTPSEQPLADGQNQPGESPGSRGPGRPRLGVVAKEVTLLPRHWEWLHDQPGGASVALRKLVDQARKANEGADRIRRSREAAYRFMVAMAGDLLGFEEASRALFAGSRARLETEIQEWPPDVRAYLLRLADAGLVETPDPADVKG